MSLDSLVVPAIYVVTLPAPALVALWRRRALSLPLALLATYGVMAFLEGAYTWHLADLGIHNLWVSHLFTPFEALMFLWMFAQWQVRDLSRLTVLFSVPLFIVLWAVLLLTAESLEDFPRYAKSVECLLIVAVAAYTLISRSQHLVAPIVRYAWFWVCVGSLVYFSYVAVLNPIADFMLPRSRDLVSAAFQLNSALGILSTFFFSRAILCQPQRTNSGGSSLPRVSSVSS